MVTESMAQRESKYKLFINYYVILCKRVRKYDTDGKNESRSYKYPQKEF
jgi:hypothetical protein